MKDAELLQYIDTKEQIADIFMRPLVPKLFRYLRKKLIGWWIKGILIRKVFWYYTHKVGILED